MVMLWQKGLLYKTSCLLFQKICVDIERFTACAMFTPISRRRSSVFRILSPI